jgi:hypothetical protein
MPYSKTSWTNETPSASPIKFTLKDTDGNVLYDDVQIELKTSVTPGTPLNSTNLNKIEQGLEDVFNLAESIELAQLVNGILTADAAGRAKMADGFVNLAKLAADLRFQKLGEYVADGTFLPNFNSIPQTFKHLILIYNGVSSRTTAGWDGFGFHVNGDTGTNYTTISHMFDAGGAHRNWGVTNPNSDGLFSAVLPSQNAGYLPSGSGITIFPNYVGTTYYKSAIQLSLYLGTYANGLMFSNSYRNNPEPITMLTGVMSPLTFPRAGSIFSLYGFN